MTTLSLPMGDVRSRYDHGERDFRLGHLTAAYLPNLNLSGAHFEGAYLYGAEFSGTNLYGACFSQAVLEHADFTRANLTAVNLDRANLIDANFREATLCYATFHGAQLYGADFTGALLPTESHEVLAEILRQHAGDNTGYLMFAGVVLLQINWCWGSFLKRRSQFPRHVWDWAIRTVKQYPDLAKRLELAEREYAEDQAETRAEARKARRLETERIKLEDIDTARLAPERRTAKTTRKATTS